MSVALVTGAAGAIGRHVTAQLVVSGWRVGGLGHGPSDWRHDAAPQRWLAGDVSPDNLHRLADWLNAPVDLLVHLTGGATVGASLRDPAEDFRRTVTTTTHVLDFIRARSPAARLVAVSSAAVYGDAYAGMIVEDAPTKPISPYGRHKYIMEQMIADWAGTFGISAVIVRLFSVYGPGLRKQMIFDLCERLAAAPDRLGLSGSGNERRDWISIHDAARLLIHIAPFAAIDAPIFNGCTGEGRTVETMARMLAKAWGLGAEVTFDGVARPGDPQSLVGSTARLATTGFKPQVSLEDGLNEVVAHAKQTLKAQASGIQDS